MQAKSEKYHAWLAAKHMESRMTEQAAVQLSHFVALQHRLAAELAAREEALHHLQDEIASQAREKAFFSELSALLDSLDSQQGAPEMTGTKGEGHRQASLIQRLATLMYTLESELSAQQDELQRVLVAHEQRIGNLTQSRDVQRMRVEAAEERRSASAVSTREAMIVYVTAMHTLESNRAISDQMRRIIVRVIHLLGLIQIDPSYLHT